MKKRTLFITSFVFIVLVFMSFNISHVRAATLYYNAGTDTDWNNPLNWWTDAGFTIPGSVPGIGDDAIIEADIGINGGPAASVNTMSVNGFSVGIPVTVASGATFNGSGINFGTITGNATFHDSSYNNSSATVTGDAVFNNSSFNWGTVSGNAIFNNLSYNAGTVSGNAIFNQASGGTITLSGTQQWGTVTGTAKGSDAVLITQFIFNDSSVNVSTALGNATFNNHGANLSGAIVSGNAIFNNDGSNGGTISGDAVFNDLTFNNTGAIVSGNATFNNGSLNYATVSGNAIFNGSTNNAFGATVSGDATFNGSSTNNGTVSTDGTFNDSSRNINFVSGNASFYDSSRNAIGGSVTGNACFATTAINSGIVGGIVTTCAASTPTVTTDSATIQSSTSADLFGTITDTGGESANVVGFEYGRTTTYGTTVSQTGTFVRQTFDNIINSLSCGDYHYRAFATNSAGTGHGTDTIFITHSCGSSGGTGGGKITPPPIVTPPTPIIPPPAPPSPPIVPTKVVPKKTPPVARPIATSSSGYSSGRTTPVNNSTSESQTSGISKVVGSVLGATRTITNNPSVKLVANVATAVPVAASLVVVAASAMGGMPLTNYLFYLLVIFSQILGFTKKPKPWGTVYDSYTKRPLPFARVEILNEQSRKLQSTITDAEGRYGFLISEQLHNIQIRVYLTKYDFPSKREPSVVEQKLYSNIYKGGSIATSGSLANLDLPMDPRGETPSPVSYFGITSVKLNNLLTSAANILFVVGTTFGLANAIVNPSAISYSILFLLFLTFLMRISGFKLKPFGLTKDTQTSKNLPFGLIALHNQTGERLNFTVSDEFGRYFLLAPKGNYTLKAYTPSHISPMRTKELPISTMAGWISREVDI